MPRKAKKTSSGAALWPIRHRGTHGEKFSSLVMTAPSIASEWPQMYLVAAWIETSTPCSNERKRNGVPQVFHQHLWRRAVGDCGDRRDACTLRRSGKPGDSQ